MLSEGRSRERGCLLIAFLAGLVYLALLGAFITVRAVVGWLT
jgi:hypothetical protein